MSPSRRTGNKRVLWRAIEVSHPVSGRGATTGGARALDTKPRTVVASRHGQRRGGAMGTSRPTATGPCSETAPWGTGGAHGNGAGCQAAHRAIGAAARWGHRALPQRDRAMGHGNGTAWQTDREIRSHHGARAVRRATGADHGIGLWGRAVLSAGAGRVCRDCAALFHIRESLRSGSCEKVVKTLFSCKCQS